MISYTFKKVTRLGATEYLVFADEDWFATVGNSWNADLLIRATDAYQIQCDKGKT